MKKILVLLLFAVALIGVITYIRTTNPNEFIIKAGKEKIDFIKLGDNRSFLDNKISTFTFAFNKKPSYDIQYINIGEKVYLDFGNNPPDQLSIKDNLLTSNGEYMYSEKETIEVPIKKENNKLYFLVRKHFASGLSSFYTENKKDFRGLRIKASWGKNEYVYALVIKTDAF